MTGRDARDMGVIAHSLAPTRLKAVVDARENVHGAGRKSVIARG